MRADQQLNGAISYAIQDFLARLTFHNTRQKGDTQGQIAKKRRDSCQMLLGENLCRRHNTGLKAIVER